MADKLEVLAKILIGGLIVGVGIILLGGVWFLLDLVAPTGKLQAFLQGSTGMQILVIGAALLAVFFLIIVFSTLWKKGYDFILDKLES
ncbi:MAG: hypothetical protein ACTSRG_00050 [Candidatus Helarchaeota archaeon]